MARRRFVVGSLLLALFVLGSSIAAPLTYVVNPQNVTAEWTHHFENCVGSGHAALALRADYQAQMRQARADIGFKQVRFHGLFIDDMSVVLPADGGSGLMYSFFNIDRIFDFLQSIGMRPLVEISFMPNLLASGNRTWSHFNANVTPPKDWNQWSDLITAFVKHLVDRYGLGEILQWNFEVWNEPNCCPDNFYTGKKEDYFQLFAATSRAAKAVDPRIRVGGPATAMSAWIPEFKAFCKEKNVPYDFISTHEYPTDPPGPQNREFFSNVLKKTRGIVGDDLPLYYTEYDDGYNDETEYAASFAVFQNFLTNGVVDVLSWWPFSDLFEEGGLRGDPYNLVFPPVAGLMNVYGIPKPSYRAFQLMHWAGNKVVDVTPGFMDHPTVGVFGVIGNGTSIFLVNWNVKNQPIQQQRIKLIIQNVPSTLKTATIYKIDSVFANALPLWIQMGKPYYLNPNQVSQLNKATELIPSVINLDLDSSVTIDLPPYAVYNIVLEM